LKINHLATLLLKETFRDEILQHRARGAPRLSAVALSGALFSQKNRIFFCSGRFADVCTREEMCTMLVARRPGCQIFIGPTYQKGRNISNSQQIYQATNKYTKWPQNRPNGCRIGRPNSRKIDLMAVKYLDQMAVEENKWLQNRPNGCRIVQYLLFIARQSEIYPNLDFFKYTIWQPWGADI
jgi:hypothetical protein